LGIHWQPLENSSTRKYFKLDATTTGVLVTHVSPVSPANNVLQPNDVILSIDGNKIADNGTVDFFGGERVFLNYLFVNKFVGEKCDMAVLREGTTHSLSFPLVSSSELQLVPLKTDGSPSYLVYGGLVFTKLTISYLREFESEEHDNWYDVAPRALVHKALLGFKESTDQEVVVLSHVLADDLNYGYANYFNVELEKFNGLKVKNLKHLHTMIHSLEEEFARFDFADKTLVILDARQVKKRSKAILRQYAIPAAHSEDLVTLDEQEK